MENERDWEEESKNWVRDHVVIKEFEKDHLKGVWDEGNDLRIDL
mgnify:CR=1 FL=1